MFINCQNNSDFVVYVLYSSKHDKIYIGFTTNLISRFYSHNLLSNKGWTIKYRPWEVVYIEFYKYKDEALRREKELKSHKGRDFIRKYIKNNY